MSLTSFMDAPKRVFAGFALHAFAMGNIFPRIGDVQQAMGVGEGALGLALIGSPVGTLLALTFGGPVVEKIGHKAVVTFGVLTVSILYALAIWAPSPVVFFLMLLPIGACIGAIEMVINLESDRVEYATGRKIMNRSHAFWSLGFFVAGMCGAFMGQIGLTPQAHLALIVPLTGLGLWIFMRDFTPAPPRPVTDDVKVPRFVLPTGPVMLLVTVTLSAMLLEGGSIDWSAIYMRDEFGAGAFLAGLAVATAALSQGIMRFVADGLIERADPVKFARGMLVLLGAGCLLVVYSQVWWLSLIGFACIGVGSAPIFPMAMSAAAQRTDRPSEVNVASLAQFSFMTFMLAPPLLGLVAEHWGIRNSFAIGLPLVVLSLIAARSLAKK